jgi:hypothetical protein
MQGNGARGRDANRESSSLEASTWCTKQRPHWPYHLLRAIEVSLFQALPCLVGISRRVVQARLIYSSQASAMTGRMDP